MTTSTPASPSFACCSTSMARTCLAPWPPTTPAAIPSRATAGFHRTRRPSCTWRECCVCAATTYASNACRGSRLRAGRGDVPHRAHPQVLVRAFLLRLALLRLRRMLRGERLAGHLDLVTDVILQTLATDELVLSASPVDVRELELVRPVTLGQAAGVLSGRSFGTRGVRAGPCPRGENDRRSDHHSQKFAPHVRSLLRNEP